MKLGVKIGGNGEAPRGVVLLHMRCLRCAGWSERHAARVLLALEVRRRRDRGAQRRRALLVLGVHLKRLLELGHVGCLLVLVDLLLACDVI